MEKSITAFMIQLFALVAGFSTTVFTVGAEKPNIVLIIADDLGYGGADQPATAPESKLDGDSEPQPVSEGRSY